MIPEAAFLDEKTGRKKAEKALKDAGDKALMKAQTAAIKYAMARAFNISWGDDPEADPKVDNIDNAPTEAPKKAPSARRAATKATTENTPELTAEALKSRIINCGIVPG